MIDLSYAKTLSWMAALWLSGSMARQFNGCAGFPRYRGEPMRLDAFRP